MCINAIYSSLFIHHRRTQDFTMEGIHMGGSVILLKKRAKQEGLGTEVSQWDPG